MYANKNAQCSNKYSLSKTNPIFLKNHQWNRFFIEKMETTNQGEKLLLLVKRDQRSAEEVAKAMGVVRTYLPRLYKMHKLPAKIIKKATKVFNVGSEFFGQEEFDFDVGDHLHAALDNISEAEAELREKIADLKIQISKLAEDLSREREEKRQLMELLKKSMDK